MKQTILTTGVACAALLSAVDARVVGPLYLQEKDLEALVARALPANAPHGYAPQINNCPSDTPTIRSAGTLSDQETSWLRNRRQETIGPMRDLLSRLNITGLDTDNYISNHQNNVSALPNIGIAISGGGYRAMLNGAGVVEAFDSRTPNSTSTGQLGGLLQSSTYFAGLSGGSWLVGSLYSNNFTSISSILSQDTSSDDSGPIWQFGNSIFEGPSAQHLQILKSAGYYAALVSDVNDKKDAGFNISITDYWGRALSYQLVNASSGGPDYTWSSIAEQEFFTNGSVPLPFIVTDGRAPGEVLIPANTTVYHFSPFELGSEDPTVYGFAPLKYVGTNFSAGSPISDSACTTGFDNVGFVYGTSSSLFNSILTAVNSTDSDSSNLFSSALQSALTSVLAAIGEDNNDIADWSPNPFYHYNNGTNLNANSHRLTLVDGGEDDQNIPFHPIIQPYRNLDVIFAVDSSADTNATNPTQGSAANWPDGASLIATYERSLADISNGTVFPSIPSQNTFFNLGLNNKPVFFGCDASNYTGPTPLIVYLPNAPYVYNSNVSTFDLSYNDTERNAIVENGYYLATQGNGTLDSEWPTCVGCAILSRSLNRTGTAVPDVCRTCFNRYCWDGTVDNSAPKAYVPASKFTQLKVTSAAGRLSSSALLAIASAVLASFALL